MKSDGNKRFLLASFKHETNTFSPVVTDSQRFFGAADVVLAGANAVAARRNTGTGLGGFIQVCEAAGIAFSVAVVAEARPSGAVQDSVFERIAGLICAEVERGGFDGILLDLHGAMVTDSHEDAEGELLRRIRRIDARVPIGVTLDMHANLYPAFVDAVTVLTGYHTYPHVDIAEAGARAARLLIDAIDGKIHPVLHWGNRPMLPHIMRQGTHEAPNGPLQQRCIELERSGAVLAASLFTGFAHADISLAGVSAVVCTDGNPAAAQQECEQLLEQAWAQRHAFVYQGRPLAQSFAQAKAAAPRPAVLLDHCDNVASGGTMDTTEVLRLAIEQRLDNAVFFAIHDPDAVALAARLGEGAEASFSLGGRAALAATGEENPPLEVQAKVVLLHDGNITRHGPMLAGLKVAMGATAVLQVGGIRIVVVAGQIEPSDKACFTSLNIDPQSVDYLIIKSRVHWRAGLGDIAGQVIECDSIGVTTSAYDKLAFHRVRRPIFPLDAI